MCYIEHLGSAWGLSGVCLRSAWGLPGVCLGTVLPNGVKVAVSRSVQMFQNVCNYIEKNLIKK
jgi:hypothetical protein